MPFVRITLSSQVAPDQREKVSAAVHHALVTEFHIPMDDYFHVIEVVDNHSLRYPQHYLGLAHTSNMVFVQIIAASGRTNQQKEKLYAAIAEQITAATNIRAADIIIILTENGSKENWSFGDGKIQDITHIRPV
jgi:phenylpyruvate tautomerase PptA (4-oxalocrotonate tautomerase family)